MERIDQFNRILSAFEIDAKCIAHQQVRNVSLYDLKLSPGTRIKELEKYSNELSLALKSISKPLSVIIPELGILRLEVVDSPNEKMHLSDHFPAANNYGTIPIFLGSSVNGNDVWSDFSQHPHTLIGGCTGSGKSTLIQVLLANLLRLKHKKVYLVDTKNADFNEYKNIDDICILNSYEEALEAINYIHSEMEWRYSIIKNKSANFFSSAKEEYPYIVLIIDEFADLIMQDSNDILHDRICRLTQKCRTAGIYCIVATQRPSADIISGTIKANFPARIACKTASSLESRIILDSNGAEALGGVGDAIMHCPNNRQRFQVPFATAADVVSLL